MIVRRLLAIATAAVCLAGCAGYTSALGFRSRRAVLENDAARFEALMEEAVETTPAGPLDDPERTVLTHFLDLAGDPLFFPYTERWLANGWIDEAMTCAIHRARYRAMRTVDPADAKRSAEVCIQRARGAAELPERQWEVERCLEEAPFLVETSTTALLPYLAMAADPNAPLKFRYGLLDGMTRVDLATPSRLRTEDASLSRERAIAVAQSGGEAHTRRLDFVVDTTRTTVDPVLLASATARGVLAVENVMVQLGRSYIGAYAKSEDPFERALAWSWVRKQKTVEPVPDLVALGLYDREKETKDDVYWYLCWREAPRDPSALVPSNVIEAVSIRRTAPVDPTSLRDAECPDYPNIDGPYPLEATARGSAVSARGDPKLRTAVRLRRRILE